MSVMGSGTSRIVATKVREYTDAITGAKKSQSSELRVHLEGTAHEYRAIHITRASAPCFPKIYTGKRAYIMRRWGSK